MKSNRYYVLNDRKGKEVIRGLRADVPLTGEDDDEQGDDMEEWETEKQKQEDEENEENEGPRVRLDAHGMTGSGGSKI